MTQQAGELNTELFRTKPLSISGQRHKEYVRTSPLNHLTAFDNAPLSMNRSLHSPMETTYYFRSIKTS